MSKYIDLAQKIASQWGTRVESPGAGLILYTLNWLDAYPDQVPGRTITESDLHGALRDYNAALYTEIDTANRLGLLVVPGPEPTNAEKLEKIVWDSDGPLGSISLDRATRLAAWLDEHGVTAPGGDDE